MEFDYFQGPPNQMSGLCADQDHKCSYCGRAAMCFCCEDGADVLSNSEQRTRIKYCCVECVKAGCQTFWHDTEIGLIDESSVLLDGGAANVNVREISPESLRSLARTPNYISCQQPYWLVHCNDFMVYLGWWQPEDFRRHATDRNGRSLLLKMTSRRAGAQPLTVKEEELLYRELDFIWPPDEPDRGEWGGMLYYAFRCRHCGKLRGYYDCD